MNDELRNRRFDEGLDEIFEREAELFRQECVERRKAERQAAESRDRRLDQTLDRAAERARKLFRQERLQQREPAAPLGGDAEKK